MLQPVGDRELELPAGAAEADAVDRRILRRDRRSRPGRCPRRSPAPPATASARRRRAGRCRCRGRGCCRSAAPPSRSRRARSGSRRSSRAGRCRRRGRRRSRGRWRRPAARPRCSRRVDEEAAGADRLEPRLAERHPVALLDLLDDRRRRRRRSATSAREQGEHRRVRLFGEIGVEPPFVAASLASASLGHQHRRRTSSQASGDRYRSFSASASAACRAG